MSSQPLLELEQSLLPQSCRLLRCLVRPATDLERSRMRLAMEQERRSVGCLVAVARMGATHVQLAVDQVGIDHVVESYLVRQLIRSAAMSAFSTNSGKEIYDAESIETGNFQDFACGRHSAWDWRINCDGTLSMSPGACTTCKGSGTKSYQCILCKGTGLGAGGLKCTHCDGRRFEPCSRCKGTGQVP